MPDFPRLDWTPHWRTMNDHLVALVDMIPDEHLFWVPREGERSAPIIFAHISMARHMGPLATPEASARLGQIPTNCRTKDGIKEELRASWQLIESFVSDVARLEAEYGNTGQDYYVDEPERYTGHYLAYHPFAHDLHHRSTIIGHFAQLGVPLDGRMVRPL